LQSSCSPTACYGNLGCKAWCCDWEYWFSITILHWFSLHQSEKKKKCAKLLCWQILKCAGCCLMGFFQFLIGNGIAVNGKREREREREILEK
jgi:hypothetical protein